MNAVGEIPRSFARYSALETSNTVIAKHRRFLLMLWPFITVTRLWLPL